MDAFLLTKEDYEEIKKELQEMKDYMKSLTNPEDRILDNQKFIKVMGISDRTASIWRNEGKIGFSQHGKKIYYRMSDIEQFLDSAYYKPFAKNKKLI